MLQSLIILGGDRNTIFRDLRSLPGDTIGSDVSAVNDASWIYPGEIKYLITHHPENLLNGPSWKKKRIEIGGNQDYTTISHFDLRDGAVDVIYPPPTLSGSSVLFAVLVGLDHLGYERVYICGAPMVEEKYKEYRYGWIAQSEKIRGRVFGMSGWTKEYLESIWH